LSLRSSSKFSSSSSFSILAWIMSLLVCMMSTCWDVSVKHLLQHVELCG
jgi:hypothetical protein